MGLWATWSGGRCPCPWQKGWNQVVLRALPIQTILWFYELLELYCSIPAKLCVLGTHGKGLAAGVSRAQQLPHVRAELAPAGSKRFWLLARAEPESLNHEFKLSTYHSKLLCMSPLGCLDLFLMHSSARLNFKKSLIRKPGWMWQGGNSLSLHSFSNYLPFFTSRAGRSIHYNQ